MVNDIDSYIEIRGFMQLYAYLKEKFTTYPIRFKVQGPITGLEISKKLGIDRDDIEVIFVNGFVQELETLVYPGDRIAFLPPGCPGPYRIALGFYGKNQNSESSFKIKKSD